MQLLKPTAGRLILMIGLLLLTFAIPIKVLVCASGDIPSCEVKTAHGIGFPPFFKPASQNRDNTISYKLDSVVAIVNILAFYGISCLLLRSDKRKQTVIKADSTANTAAK